MGITFGKQLRLGLMPGWIYSFGEFSYVRVEDSVYRGKRVCEHYLGLAYPQPPYKLDEQRVLVNKFSLDQPEVFTLVPPDELILLQTFLP